MAKEKSLLEKVEEIVGFGAVVKLGRITDPEKELIAEYCESRGGNYDYIMGVLDKRGRPYDVSDYTFDKNCLRCTDLRNYCHC